jgi:arylsulfatase A-like enzyme
MKTALFILLAIATVAAPPNIVYIMSDELAYYELGHMGNPDIQTPRIDQMAAEGLRFTQALAGAPVCGPLRCTLMTGKHMGHASVRANDGGTPLRAGEATIASMLKAKGYATGGYGKWGCGGRGSSGVPEAHGFDDFFGYYDQVHAHSFYPAYLVRNSQEVVMPGNYGGRSGDTYTHYEIMGAGLQFIRANAERPFFAYFPITPPHGMYDIPDADPGWALYRDKDWPEDARRYAAMVTMVDRNVGQVLDLLKELSLEENTIVFFAGDNGGQDRFRTKDKPRGFFGPNVHPKTGVEFRGGKGQLYEGGLRIPSIVRWPGKIEPGRVSDLAWYQPDILPTLAELTGSQVPADIDGMSILPEIFAQPQKPHEFLYWEYGGQTAVRMGMWKAIRPKAKADWELYDLRTDVSEAKDVAAANSAILSKMIAHAESAHTPVKSGTFTDRSLHEKDRQAKFGSPKPATLALPNPNWSRKGLLKSEAFSLLRFSSESTANSHLARHAIDGDPGSWWHSNFTGKTDIHPHELVIDLGDEYTVTGLRYLARQDTGWNGSIADCEISIANSADFADAKPIAHRFAKKKAVQEFTFDVRVGRYFRLRVLSEINDGPWATIAEIGVIGK